jgi:hypothetical protein
VSIALDSFEQKRLRDVLVEARDELREHNAEAKHVTHEPLFEALAEALRMLGHAEPTGECVDPSAPIGQSGICKP